MPAIGDLVMAIVMFAPLIVLAICLPLAVTHQPRWVRATAVTLAALTVVSWLGYWILWGQAFEYADSDIYTPVPASLDHASNIAMVACSVLSLIVVAFGASRLVMACREGHDTGIGGMTPA